MPKPDSSGGTFSDLYEAMQTKRVAPSPEPPSPVPSPEPVERRQVTKAPSRLVTKTPSHQGAKVTNHQASDETLTDREYFRCTKEEVWAIEDLKRKIERDWDIKTTKQDLERFSISQMLEDYTKRGEQSFIVQLLRKRQK